MNITFIIDIMAPTPHSGKDNLQIKPCSNVLICLIWIFFVNESEYSAFILVPVHVFPSHTGSDVQAAAMVLEKKVSGEIFIKCNRISL